VFSFQLNAKKHKLTDISVHAKEANLQHFVEFGDTQHITWFAGFKNRQEIAAMKYLTRYNVIIARFTRCKMDVVAFHTRQALEMTMSVFIRKNMQLTNKKGNRQKDRDNRDKIDAQDAIQTKLNEQFHTSRMHRVTATDDLK